MTDTNSQNRTVEILYQKYPKQKSRHPRSKSKTESIESFLRAAAHEAGRLLVNGTEPNHIVQLNYKTELSVKEIKELWRKHSRRLRRAGIVAAVTIEITKDEWGQRPVNRVHYHFAAKDDRTPEELEELFEGLCGLSMKQSDFNVGVRPFDETQGGWKGYIAYHVKLRNKKDKKNYLFKRGLRLRKYFVINREKWWTYPDGITPRTLTSIKNQMKRYKIIKDRLKESERFIAMKSVPLKQDRPTNFAKLKEVLDNESERAWYDWYSILTVKPTVFQTVPPDWLPNLIQSRLRQFKDLLKALAQRLQNADSLEVYYALQIYHNW